MPISTHTTEISTQANGDRHVILRMYDQDGQQYMISFFFPAALDLDVAINNRIAEQNVQLAEQEFEALVGAA